MNAFHLILAANLSHQPGPPLILRYPGSGVRHSRGISMGTDRR
jgi:hypothetical protein